jgi:hypothetical protein
MQSAGPNTSGGRCENSTRNRIPAAGEKKSLSHRYSREDLLDVDGSRKEQRPVPADQLSEFSERVMTHEQKTPHANCNLQAEYAGSVKEAPDKPSFAPIPIHSVPKADRQLGPCV